MTSVQEVRKVIGPLGYTVFDYREFEKSSRLSFVPPEKTICFIILNLKCHISECTLEEVLQRILLEAELLKLGMKPLPKLKEAPKQ